MINPQVLVDQESILLYSEKVVYGIEDPGGRLIRRVEVWCTRIHFTEKAALRHGRRWIRKELERRRREAVSPYEVVYWM